MDRVWQWAWDRYGPRYSWAVWAIMSPLMLPIALLPSFVVVGYEQSGHYVEAASVAAVTTLAAVYLLVLPGLGWSRLAEQWASGQEVDRAAALDATYTYARRAAARSVTVGAVWFALVVVVVGGIAGASGSRLVQYGVFGAVSGAVAWLISVHSVFEMIVRPVRVALIGDTAIGDSRPRSRPTFAAWTSVSVLAVGFVFAVSGAALAAVFERTSEGPVLWLAIGCGLTLFFGVPFSVGLNFSPSMRPVRDLAEGTERVAAGDYSRRLPVVQDDDLGALAGSFNRMQAGLAERQRLHAAFGTYVDPALAVRLLEQGDEVFTGERREVTVMFVDIRDFTPFAEANTAEDTVSRLNALFEIVVPAVVDAGGHVNKFLGDGALAVFGAPNDLVDHADAAVTAAALIHRLVAERFSGELRIGIEINTGVVIAGTIGGGGKLEFTLIGDTVNVAARVEQLTKNTGDAILLTQGCVDALVFRPPGLINRGLHALKGKADPVQVFGLDPRGRRYVGLIPYADPGNRTARRWLTLATHPRRGVEQTGPSANARSYVTASQSQCKPRSRPHEQAMTPTSIRPSPSVLHEAGAEVRLLKCGDVPPTVTNRFCAGSSALCTSVVTMLGESSNTKTLKLPPRSGIHISRKVGSIQ